MALGIIHHSIVAEIKHLRANQVLHRSQNKDYKDRKLRLERGLRLACSYGSSSLTKDKACAHEGVLIMLMEDMKMAPQPGEYETECDDEFAKKHGGQAHIV